MRFKGFSAFFLRQSALFFSDSFRLVSCPSLTDTIFLQTGWCSSWWRCRCFDRDGPSDDLWIHASCQHAAADAQQHLNGIYSLTLADSGLPGRRQGRWNGHDGLQRRHQLVIMVLCRPHHRCRRQLPLHLIGFLSWPASFSIYTSTLCSAKLLAFPLLSSSSLQFRPCTPRPLSLYLRD